MINYPSSTIPFPTGALQYGEEGEFSVWHQAPTGRFLYVFDDVYLAQRFAVSVGSEVLRK